MSSLDGRSGLLAGPVRCSSRAFPRRTTTIRVSTEGFAVDVLGLALVGFQNVCDARRRWEIRWETWLLGESAS